MNYLRAQVNFRQLRAETAGNRYLRRFLPASAGIFTCGSVYLRPSQVILHAPVLQCMCLLLFSGTHRLYLPKLSGSDSPKFWRQTFKSEFVVLVKLFDHGNSQRVGNRIWGIEIAGNQRCVELEAIEGF